MFAQLVHQVVSVDSLGKAGEVFDLGGCGELATGLLAFEDQRIEVGSRGIDSRREPGAAGSEDNDVFHDFVVVELSYGQTKDFLGWRSWQFFSYWSRRCRGLTVIAI